MTATSRAPLAIGHVTREEFPTAAALLADALRFTAADAIPAWMMATTDRCGGITLVARSGADVVGVSYAFPGHDQRGPHLFSCGLAVAPWLRGRGIGRRLKLAQRDAARASGHRRIVWTADPLNAPALHLYLSRLGARLVAYRPGLYAGLRAGGPADDVEIEWDLERPAGADDPAAERRSVELRPDVAMREPVTALLEAGFVGTAVTFDRAAGLTFLRFSKP